MRRHLAVLILAAAWATGRCGAQSATPPNPATGPAPCSVTPQPDPCASTAAPAKQVPANKFPFPGEPASSTAPARAPSREDVPSAPGAPAATPDSVKKFPFPGESAASSSSSSSSSSGADATTVDPDANPATPGLTDKGSEGAPPAPGRHILHRVNPIGTKLQSNDERESEDLSVAQFYMQSGDVKGAYLRSQDAVKIAPDDPDAHFLLAETALKLNKKDEAIAEYNACLKLDPIEKEAKDARKALARLKP